MDELWNELYETAIGHGYDRDSAVTIADNNLPHAIADSVDAACYLLEDR